MHGLMREQYLFTASTKVLTRHMYSRMYCGKIIVVTDKPKVLLSPLRKQWLKLARKVQVERAKTLQGARIKELTAIVATMQTLRFSAEWSEDDYLADVYLATLEQLLQWPPQCATMYVTYSVDLEKLHMITSWMPKSSLVVIYE